MALTSEQMVQVLNALPDPVFVLTESGTYVGLFGHADPNYYHDGSDLVGLNLHSVMPADVADWIKQQIQLSLSKKRLIKVEYPLSASQVKGLENQAGPDGIIWFEGHIQPFPKTINGERAVIWVARNITERKLLEAKLLQASLTDPLTGVWNRRHLMETLDHTFADFRRYKHPAALIMFDIDHFKRINDEKGHLEGDKVLKTLCNIFSKALRENDMLARSGGEEFIILLPNITEEKALLSAERLRTQAVEDCQNLLGDEYVLTVSFGVSEFKQSDQHVQDVLLRIDKALYQAKNQGRNQSVLFGGKSPSGGV